MTTSSQADDQRAAARFDSALPVELDGSDGRTRNISQSGVYFETDLPREVGELVHFTVEFHLHGQRHRLSCEGKVVRVDAKEGRIGVAAHLVAPFFAEPERVELTAAMVDRKQPRQ